MKKLLPFIIALFVSTNLLSQIPQSFKYQAVLRDARGNIKANTATNIVIGIIPGSATGTAVYSETHNTTTDGYGLINLEIGKGTVTVGSFSGIDWGTNTYFVKVTVDGVDMGASQLLSVPYALYAKASGGYTESDPVFTAWNKTTGISIPASQVSDFQSSVTNNPAVLLNTAKNGYPTADANKLAAIKGTNTGDQDLSGLATATSVTTGLATKVDKVTGKGLSTNDYTTAEQTKVSNLSGTNTGDQDLSGLATTTSVTTGLATKVDKVAGKGLSTNDYSATEQTKLAAISGSNTGDNATNTQYSGLDAAKANLSGATFTGAISASNLSGTNTGDQTNITGNAATVTTNANLTGDVTSSGNATTLSSTAVIAATYGSSTQVPVFAVDAKGRVTGVTNTTITGTSPVGSALTSANILVGSATNVAAAVVMSGDVTIDNAGATTIGTTKVTNAMLAGSIDLTSKVTGLLAGANGGTGTSNTGKTITLGGNVNTAGDLTTTGAYSTSLNATAATSVTLPTTGTLATLAGTEALTNKTINGLTPIAVATGFTIAGGSTTTKTLTVPLDASVSGTNTGDQTNITGNAATVTTNANLTGAVTSLGNATSLGSFTSANLSGALSDKTGTGVAVFATSPTLVTPVIGAATGTSLSVTGSLTSTVATGTAPLIVTSTTPVTNLSIGGNAATATTATNVSGTVAIANGGTGQTTQQTAINSLTGTQSAGKYLRSDGTNSTLSSIQATDVPTLNQNTTGNASTATNIAGGSVGLLPYQSAANTTALLAVGTIGQVLTSNGAAAPTWTAPNSGWALTGNAGTVDGTNFIGTTDNAPFNIRVFGEKAGRIENDAFTANTFFGFHAGMANTTGINNTASGYIALYSNTTGSHNTANGYQALYSNFNGAENTANGISALYANTSGSHNTANGQNALYGNMSGNNNTAIGSGALVTNAIGSDNTAIGYSADVYGNYSNSTAIGANARVEASNRVQIGNTAVTDIYFGDGTTTVLHGVLVREVADEFTATASQTAFTLSQTPSGKSKVKMYINGIRISNTAYSLTGTALTYIPGNNGSYALLGTDRIQFDYFY